MGPQAWTAALCSSEHLATLTQKPQFHCTVSSLTTMSQLQSLQALINFESLATVFTTCLLINRIIMTSFYFVYLCYIILLIPPSLRCQNLVVLAL